MTERTIALVGPLPPPSGGMANQTLQLARLLQESGVTVKIVRVNPPYRPACVGHLRGIRAGFRIMPYLWQLWSAAGHADLMHVMANSGLAWHLFAAPAIWIASLRRIPVIVNYRGGEAERFLERQIAWVKFTLRRAHSVAVPSLFLEGVFSRFGVKTEIVPNIIDLARFHPSAMRISTHHIVVTRNLEDIYDIPTALRAFVDIRRIHPDARLTIAGSGPRLIDLQALADALGISGAVRFTGRLDNEQIAELCRDADLLLNPSTADNMPISLIEAMASGVPIVSTDVGGIPYLVTDPGTALLVSPKDPAAMAAAALRIFDDPELAASLRQTGLHCAAKFTWVQVKPRLFALYARALGATSLDTCET